MNKNVTSNKTKHIKVNKKLDYLEQKVKLISTKGLTKNFLNKYSIFNGAKKFSPDGFKNYLVFIFISKYLTYFSSNDKVYSWKSKIIYTRQ